jgi:hypothetical protein
MPCTVHGSWSSSKVAYEKFRFLSCKMMRGAPMGNSCPRPANPNKSHAASSHAASSLAASSLAASSTGLENPAFRPQPAPPLSPPPPRTIIIPAAPPKTVIVGPSQGPQRRIIIPPAPVVPQPPAPVAVIPQPPAPVPIITRPPAPAPVPVIPQPPAPAPASAPVKPVHDDPCGHENLTAPVAFRAFLTETNKYRREHGAPCASWSTRAQAAAAAQAAALVELNKDRTDLYLEHGNTGSGALQMGQNLYAVKNLGPGIKSLPTIGLARWMAEESLYKYSKPGFSEKTGHFTQVVWKDSTGVGCDVKTMQENNKAFLACNYTPAGNWLGQFGSQVLPAGTPPTDG